MIAKCVNCNNFGESHIHHVVPIAVGGTENKGNKVLLCETCHGLIHGKNFVKSRELQRVGIEKAKKEGKFKGRVSKKLPDNFSVIYEQYKNKEITKGNMAIMCGVSRPVMDKLLKNNKYVNNVKIVINRKTEDDLWNELNESLIKRRIS